MINAMEHARHATERGEILRQLVKDFTSPMTAVATLSRALFMVGRELTSPDMQFHLAFLEASGYVFVKRANETPGWRADRANESKGDMIVMVRLTPKGLKLHDGLIPADESVSF